jgi:hypothetical protein
MYDFSYTCTYNVKCECHLTSLFRQVACWSSAYTDILSVQRRFVLYEPACIRFAIEAKIADILVGHPEGLPVSDIAKKAGIDQGKLARILRFLAMKHCFREGANTSRISFLA